MGKSLLSVDPQLDEEASDSDEASTGLSMWRRRGFLKGAGLSLVVAAVVGTVCMMMRSNVPSANSAHHLMHSQEFHRAVRERVLLTASANGHTLSADDVDREISQDLGNIFVQLDQKFPEISQKLKDGILPQDQSKALLKMVERQHDKRLKELGEKAIRVVLTNALFGPKTTRERLLQKFQPDMPELMAMYKQIVPAPVREAKAKWYESMRKKTGGEAQASSQFDGAWEFLLHPRAISIMKTFGSPANQTSVPAERRLSTTPTKLGVGITGFVMNSVNMLVVELAQLLDFGMPWWGWLLTLLPGVSLGTTSCIIAPITESYADFWCIDFLMFTGMQALEILATSSWDKIVK
jgi:hypothetical protein